MLQYQRIFRCAPALVAGIGAILVCRLVSCFSSSGRSGHDFGVSFYYSFSGRWWASPAVSFFHLPLMKYYCFFVLLACLALLEWALPHTSTAVFIEPGAARTHASLAVVFCGKASLPDRAYTTVCRIVLDSRFFALFFCLHCAAKVRGSMELRCPSLACFASDLV